MNIYQLKKFFIRYIELYFDSHLSWKRHINYIARKVKEVCSFYLDPAIILITKPC